MTGIPETSKTGTEIRGAQDIKFFNAQHSPIGSLASFVLGARGAKGGLGQNIGKPADQHVFIGAEARDGSGVIDALPFFDQADDASLNFTQHEAGQEKERTRSALRVIADADIAREFQLTSDTWTAAGDGLQFRVVTQVRAVPDADADAEDGDVGRLKQAVAPLVFAQLTVDNTASAAPRRAVFGMQAQESARVLPGLRHVADARVTGVTSGRAHGFFALNHLADVASASGFSADHILAAATAAENWRFGLGQCALLVFAVPPHASRTYNIALCWHDARVCTTGLDARFLYNRFFSSLLHVAHYAAEHQDSLIDAWLKPDRLDLFDSMHKWNVHQKFQLIHAVHSYFGSSQLLETVDEHNAAAPGKPVWVINEGEYLMMNTSDLMVDQAFFEVSFNPWTIRNNLELFLARYSFHDTVTRFGETTEYPGGLSFCHDMGVANAFSPPQTSAYECVKLDDCFSHMTCEELLNWTLTAGIYIHKGKNEAWATKHISTFKELLTSLCNRDAPNPKEYTGLIGMESTRTLGGAEITTYDSLDPSLAQTRNNAYIGGKCWAAYLVLEKILRDNGFPDDANLAHAQAVRGAATIAAALSDEGYIPAILDVGHQARIIPAIEGLVYPLFTGCENAVAADGEFKEYIGALKIHFENVLKRGVCLFEEDGGWKLSSTSINSWLSKIYLNQFVARKILGHEWGPEDVKADATHVYWLTDKSFGGYWCWSDQMYSGVATGSLFYPRGVT
ncbi:hypothetical protein HK100_004878, partial [Physocladia obscura]